MNERAAVDAVVSVIEEGKDAVTTGIFHQGQKRERREIFSSSLTPPKEGYSLTVHCTNAREQSIPQVNVRLGKSYVEYDIEIHLAEPAYMQQEDETAFETMHNDFRDVIGRLVRLLREDTVAFPDTTSNPKFIVRKSQPRDPAVTVENRSKWYDAGEGGSPVLYSIIRFTIVDHCSDSSLV